MNNFHVYEAIGRGKSSTVYKGRKKKTIEYFAIKSVSKSRQNEVLHEVGILHSLDHPNILKFYSWYETSTHLWLILEYCVGGNLMILLRQDGQLPEDSIHDLALGIVRALQFLHSEGVIYCDLKPSNILLDENGHTKLCDFGLAKNLSNVSRTPSMLRQAKRGTPCYMAPELFEDGGVHSYASDFWALGCVLFECYAGRPPYVGNEFTQLAKSIISDPIPPLPGNPTTSFSNLLNSLLLKDPAERIQWSELCQHAFWRVKLDLVPLPPQPAFEIMIGMNPSPSFQDQNGEAMPSSRSHEKAWKAPQKQPDDPPPVARSPATPVKSSERKRNLKPKAPSKAVDEKLKDYTSTTTTTATTTTTTTARCVNLLRLSKIARSNLVKENEKENYRRRMPNTSEIDSEVKIENTDMELDFNENKEDEVHDENEKEEAEMVHGEMDAADCRGQQPETDPMDEPRTNGQDASTETNRVASTPPRAGQNPKSQGAKEVSNSPLGYDSDPPFGDVSGVLWHQTDLSVRPVMPSKKVDKMAEVMCLPFEVLCASDFVKLCGDKHEMQSNRIISALNGNALPEKQSAVRYLEMLSSNSDAANLLTNGPIMLVLVKMLRLSKAPALRIQLVSLIGLLIRHSTCIRDDLANSGILALLVDGLRDKQERVKRFSMAALGELLFYISTSQDHSARDITSPSGWQVPNSLISLVSSLLRKGEDDIAQLYALRTIENICSQGGYWAARFASQDVINNLCCIYKASGGKQESMRITAGSCLVRIARFNPPTIQPIMDKLSFKDTSSALVKGTVREQQISLNLLNMALLGSHLLTNIVRHVSSIADDKNLLQCLISLAEQGSAILKGKALVFVASLCKNSRRCLPQFLCNARLLSAVDRMTKEKDGYLVQCLDALVLVVASTLPKLLDTVAGDIQQLTGGRRIGGHISVAGSRIPLKSNLHLLLVVLHLLKSSAFKHVVWSHQVLQKLAILVHFLESPFQGRDEVQITLLRILESMAEESDVILKSTNVVTGEILPRLFLLYRGNKDGDARFLCLKIVLDVMMILLEDAEEDERRSRALNSISHVHFLPLYPIMIEDEDPIPMYAQKLLVMLIGFDYINVSDILHPKTISQCFEFLLGDFANANVNNIKLCLALASAAEVDSELLSQLKLVRRIGSLLEFVHAKEMVDFLDPTLELCRAFLTCSVGAKVGTTHGDEPALLCDGRAIAVPSRQGISDVADFGSCVGLFLELTATCKDHGADVASECLVMALRAAPREAAACVLTNLPRVNLILAMWPTGFSHLLLLRILHALRFSCWQYSSHSLILSISIPEISKIETTLSLMNISGISDLASAASLALSELQRLSRAC